MAHDQWGLALLEPDGTVREVLWPNGYAARPEGNALVLIDESGVEIAREGARLSIAGGEATGDSGDAAWRVCGGIEPLDGS